MIRVTAFAAAAVLMATAVQPAAAEDLKVKVAGKSEAAVQADIRAAAHRVCADDSSDFQLGMPQPEDIAQCERITAGKAAERLAREIAAKAAANQQLATLSSPAKPGRR